MNDCDYGASELRMGGTLANPDYMIWYDMMMSQYVNEILYVALMNTGSDNCMYVSEWVQSSKDLRLNRV